MKKLEKRKRKGRKKSTSKEREEERKTCEWREKGREEGKAGRERE